MGLIDRDKVLILFDGTIARQRINAGDNMLANMAVDLVQTSRDFVAAQDVIDPIHYAGGCYCRECEFWTHDDDVDFLCAIFGKYTQGDSFCSYGRRREGADG